MSNNQTLLNTLTYQEKPVSHPRDLVDNKKYTRCFCIVRHQLDRLYGISDLSSIIHLQAQNKPDDSFDDSLSTRTA